VLGAAAAEVAVLDVNPAAASATAALVDGTGGHGLALEADVNDLGAVETAIDAAVRAVGRPDVLVDKPGWTLNEPFIDSAAETWQKIVAINYVGVLNCTRA